MARRSRRILATYYAPPPGIFWGGLAIGFGIGIGIGLWGDWGWGWGHWGMGWHSHAVFYNHGHYYTRSTTVINRGFSRPGGPGRGFGARGAYARPAGGFNHPGGTGNRSNTGNRGASGTGRPGGNLDVQASPDVQAVPPDARREQVTVQEQPRPGHSLITELAQGLAAHVPPAEPTAAELTAAAAEVTRDTADDRCSVKLR